MTDQAQLVLVISDAAEERLFIEGACAQAFAVRCAASVEEGLVTARRIQPAVVVMAVRGGSPDAWVASRRLKADPLTARTPVVVITAAAPERRALRESRADVTLPYPADEAGQQDFGATLVRTLVTLASARGS